MKKVRFTAEQILQALRQAESGTVVREICRKLGVTEATFCRWRKQYAGLDVGELRELGALIEDNRKLRQVVEDLVLDKTILTDALGKKGEPTPASRGGKRPIGSASAAPAASWTSSGRRCVIGHGATQSRRSGGGRMRPRSAPHAPSRGSQTSAGRWTSYATC